MGRYEIQVLDSFGKERIAEHDCGAIYQRWDPKRGKGKEGLTRVTFRESMPAANTANGRAST